MDERQKSKSDANPTCIAMHCDDCGGFNNYVAIFGRSVGMRRGRPAKTLIQPTILESGLYPAIAVPMSLIGKHILVPGSYWPRSGQNREELATLYQCVVRDYTTVHKFLNGKSSRTCLLT